MSDMKQKADAFIRLVEIMDRLRVECPWDKKQTISSLRYLTIEEVYELSDAILEKDFEEIKKELGDLLLHIVFYSRIASEENKFDITDVLNTISDKLVHRHPHIYGDVKVKDEKEVKENWEKLKLKEGKKSVLEGVPKSLPAVVKAYEVSLLILASLVIKADGQIRQEELNYVKTFFSRTFGEIKAKKYFEIFNTLNKQSLSSQLRAICLQLTQSINHASRLQIVHFLFGVASSDNDVHQSEINLINKIATYLNVSSQDFQSISAMFVKGSSSLDNYYKILEVDKKASIDEIKKSYRKLVMKYHPDKLQGVSDDIVKLANEKFLSIQEAYEKIMQHRS